MVYKWNADRIKGRDVHNSSPNDGDVLKWNESEQRWEPSKEDITEAEFDDHSARHESGGSDEINVDGLSGELSDPQPPKDHSHDSGDISPAGSDGHVQYNSNGNLAGSSGVTVNSDGALQLPNASVFTCEQTLTVGSDPDGHKISEYQNKLTFYPNLDNGGGWRLRRHIGGSSFANAMHYNENDEMLFEQGVVGIGTTSPDGALDVDGDVYVRDNLSVEGDLDIDSLDSEFRIRRNMRSGSSHYIVPPNLITSNAESIIVLLCEHDQVREHAIGNLVAARDSSGNANVFDIRVVVWVAQSGANVGWLTRSHAGGGEPRSVSLVTCDYNGRTYIAVENVRPGTNAQTRAMLRFDGYHNSDAPDAMTAVLGGDVSNIQPFASSRDRHDILEGGLNVTDYLEVDGDTVWHAGNFDPATKADQSDLDSHTSGGLSEHGVSDLNDLNTDLGSNIDESGDTRPPESHSTSHESGGSDELNVGGLSGVLADRQDADKLQGAPVSTNSPSGGDVLNFDGTQWVPTDIPVPDPADYGEIAIDGLSEVVSIPSSNDYVLADVATKTVEINNFSMPSNGILKFEGNEHPEHVYYVSANLTLFAETDTEARIRLGVNGFTITETERRLAIPGRAKGDIYANTALSTFIGLAYEDEVALYVGNWLSSDNITITSMSLSVVRVTGIEGPKGDTGDVEDHQSQHEAGGSDEINVTGLSGELADPQKPKISVFSYENRENIRSENPEDGEFALIEELGLFKYDDTSEEPEDKESSFTNLNGSGMWLLEAIHWDFAYKYFGSELDNGTHGAGEFAVNLRRNSVSKAEFSAIMATEEGRDLFRRAVELYGPSLMLKLPDVMVSSEDAMKEVIKDEIAVRSMLYQPLPQRFSNATMTFGEDPETMLFILRHEEEGTSDGVDMVMDLTHYSTLKVYARADTFGDTSSRMKARVWVNGIMVFTISGNNTTLSERDVDITDYSGNCVVRFGYDSTSFGEDSPYEAEFGRFWLTND